MLCVTKRSAMGCAMAISPSKGACYGLCYGLCYGSVPRSIERYTSSCYGVLAYGAYT